MATTDSQHESIPAKVDGDAPVKEDVLVMVDSGLGMLDEDTPATGKPAPASPLDDENIYEPLVPESREIRILEIYNDSLRRTDGSHSEILSFKFQIISLEEQLVPFYDAISYTRETDNEASDGARISVDGQILHIPKSTEAALRACCVSRGHYRVWVDAVCIDPLNRYERDEQVSYMHMIYAKATRVVVWFGGGGGPQDAPLGAVERLFNSLKPPGLDRVKRPHSMISGPPPLSKDPAKFKAFAEWATVYKFFANRWFTRAWVIQEVCASHHAVCYHGHYHKAVDFWNIALLANHLHERRKTLPKNPDKRSLSGIENASILSTLRRAGPQPLTSLLRTTYSFKVSDPHDMVFAILGLRHSSQQQPDSETRIIPIYEEPILETYAKATKAAIAESGSLGLLGRAHSLRPIDPKSTERNDFPSWAIRMDLRGRYHFNPISYRSFRFNASADSPLILWPNESPRVLRVQGVIVDRIVSVSDCMRWKQTDGSLDTLTAAAVLNETYSWTLEQFPLVSDEKMAYKFATTVAAGQDASGRYLAENRSHAERLKHGFYSMTMTHSPSKQHHHQPDDLHSNLSVSSLTSLRSADVPDFETDLAADSPDVTYALSAMMRSGHRRTIFTTERATFLGLGTDNVQPGDALCVLFGGSVPFVLRPEKHFWRFVGDAYVEKIMQGEWIRGLRETDSLKKSRRWFKIR